MFSRNGSYFDPELRIDGHYIVTGATDDLFCSDALELTDLLPELHRYLRYEQGFDAVFFFDSRDMLYTFDEQSYRILTRAEGTGAAGAGAGRAAGASAGSGAHPSADDIRSSGPLGGRRRRHGAAGAPGGNAAGAQPVRETPAAGARGPLNRGRIIMHRAWQEVSAAMRSSGARCAVIFPNANTMEWDPKTLTELSSWNGLGNAVAIYVFRETERVELRDESPFARDIIRPRACTADPAANRVITLGPPNSREIANLLNRLRFDGRHGVDVRAADIPQLGDALAVRCGRDRWGLNTLLTRLSSYAAAHPGAQLSLQTYRAFTGDEGAPSPLEELDALVGQEAVKEEIRDMVAAQRRRGFGRRAPLSASRLAPLPQGDRLRGFAQNVRLTGAPGTGKTTIAQLLGRTYYHLGILPTGHTEVCSAGTIVSGAVGQSAANMHAAVERALGGTIFIDEAYALLENSHGREAIDQLVNDITAYEGQLAVVIAGYQRQIDELMEANDGLASRIPTEYRLLDYTPAEMERIFIDMVAADPRGIEVSPELAGRLDDFFSSWVGGAGRTWANAREAAGLIDRMWRRASRREAAEGVTGGTVALAPADVPEDLRHCLVPQAQSVAEALERIDGMIGLANVSGFMRELVQGIVLGQRPRTPGNYLFVGPPGTGKTTMARQTGTLLGLLGVLRRKTNNVTECRAADLLNGSRDLAEEVEAARGGVFFLDEAHQLAQSDRGRAIIRALVPLIEDPEIRADTCFICAGYTVEMRAFMAADDGMERRFPRQNRLRFNDYSASELTQILEEKAREAGQVPTAGYLDRSRMALAAYLEGRPRNFGNGGFIRDEWLPESIRARTRRLNATLTGSADGIPTAEEAARLTREERVTLTELDLPAGYTALAGPLGRRPEPERGALERIDALVGKNEIKAFAHARAQGDAGTAFFDEQGDGGICYAITGPAGSGRHTAARALAPLWKELGLLEQDLPLVRGKGDFEAGYVGQTAIRTRDIIEQARGGTLVVDAPSSLLARDAQDRSFGPEALAELAGAVSAHANDLSIVFIDTPEGMERVLAAVPALRSQLAGVFELEDLSPHEMELVFAEKTRLGMAFEPELEALLPDFFVNWVSDRGGLADGRHTWGNGAEVEKLAEDLKVAWAAAGGETREKLVGAEPAGGEPYRVPARYITRDLFPAALARYLERASAVSDAALAELEALPGLAGVKRSVRAVERRFRRLGRAGGGPGCYLFSGNPGVGKTKVSRLMGGVLKAAGALEQGHVIERTARQMAEQLDEFDAVIKLARGGILFIDEAHQLADPQNPWGAEVLKRLLTVLEDASVTSCTCIILAGYPRHLDYLIDHDPGLASRFGGEDARIEFEDYTADELMEVLGYMAARADAMPEIGAAGPLEMTEGFIARSRDVMASAVAARDPRFGNARFVRTYLHDALSRQLERLDEEFGLDAEPPAAELNLLRTEDVPRRFESVPEGFARRAEEETATRVDAATISCRPGAPIGSEGYEAAVDELALGTVLLECRSGGRATGYASGMIVSADGYVLTCEHVVRDAEAMRARIACPGAPGGDTRWVDAKILRPAAEDCDMALIKLEGSNFNAVSLRRPSEGVGRSERTMIVGFPRPDSLTAGNATEASASHFEGRISSIERARGVERCYVDSTALCGNSGSPVFSLEDRRVIGVFCGSVLPDLKHSVDELNYFHPIHYFWERFAEGSPNLEGGR